MKAYLVVIGIVMVIFVGCNSKTDSPVKKEDIVKIKPVEEFSVFYQQANNPDGIVNVQRFDGENLEQEYMNVGGEIISVKNLETIQKKFNFSNQQELLQNFGTPIYDHYSNNKLMIFDGWGISKANWIVVTRDIENEILVSKSDFEEICLKVEILENKILIFSDKMIYVVDLIYEEVLTREYKKNSNNKVSEYDYKELDMKDYISTDNYDVTLLNCFNLANEKFTKAQSVVSIYDLINETERHVYQDDICITIFQHNDRIFTFNYDSNGMYIYEYEIDLEFLSKTPIQIPEIYADDVNPSINMMPIVKNNKLVGNVQSYGFSTEYVFNFDLINYETSYFGEISVVDSISICNISFDK